MTSPLTKGAEPMSKSDEVDGVSDALSVILHVTDIPQHKSDDAEFLRGVLFCARDYAKAAHESLAALAATPDPAVSSASDGDLFDRQPDLKVASLEPSLRTVLRSYYRPWFSEADADRLTERYIAALRSPTAEVAGELKVLQRLCLIQARELKRLDPEGQTPADLDAAMEALRSTPTAEVAGEVVVPAGWAEIYVGDGRFALCDWSDFDLVKGYWWRKSSKRGDCVYAQTHDSHDTATRNRITMHGLIMAPPDGMCVDHINGDGLDNRRSNLRVASFQQNSWNQSGHGGRSKFKGVSFRSDTNVWRAYLTKDGRREWLGSFASEQDAARAYNIAAKEAFGEYAKLNDIH